MRPMGTAAYGGKGQGKGKGRGEGRLGQGGRGRSKGGEKPMGTTAYGGKGSKGRAANGDRPVGAVSCRRDHHTMASCQNPPTCNLPTNVVTVPPLGGGGGGLHHKTVPQYHSVNQLRRLWRVVKISFGGVRTACTAFPRSSSAEGNRQTPSHVQRLLSPSSMDGCTDIGLEGHPQPGPLLNGGGGLKERGGGVERRRGGGGKPSPPVFVHQHVSQ